MQTDGQESDNIEDRRGDDSGGGGGGFALGGRHIGIGGIIVAIAASYFFGIDPRVVLGLMGSSPSPQAQSTQVQAPSHVAAGQAGGQAGAGQASPAPQDPLGRFVAEVLHSTEITWSQIFRSAGQTYRQPHLVLYSGGTATACGKGDAASGPFYCPNDEKVYIDLDFYRELQQRFHAPGEFAEAYVVAHEVGHHVQNLVGTMGKVDQMRNRLTEAQNNALSVRLELQADCYAGVWAHEANLNHTVTLDPGDLESALRAATAIGDDALQKQARGYVVPESFTHGTSAQRVKWFRTGFDSGAMNQCDTFNANPL